MKPSHTIRRKVVAIQSIAPNNSGLCLSSLECDQISALLSDYLAFTNRALRYDLDDAKAVSASRLLEKWRTQAADLLDKLEAR